MNDEDYVDPNEEYFDGENNFKDLDDSVEITDYPDEPTGEGLSQTFMENEGEGDINIPQYVLSNEPDDVIINPDEVNPDYLHPLGNPDKYTYNMNYTEPKSPPSVETDIITIYRKGYKNGNDIGRSEEFTICGDLTRVKATTFFDKLTERGFCLFNEPTCVKIYFPTAERCGKETKMTPEEHFNKYKEDSDYLEEMLDKYLTKKGIVFLYSQPDIVAISPKPFNSSMIRVCGDFVHFKNEEHQFLSHLNKWGRYDNTQKCWEFDKRYEKNVVNFFRSHGWTVYKEGQIVHMKHGGRYNKKGEFVYSSDVPMRVTVRGKLVPLSSYNKPPPMENYVNEVINVEDTLKYQIGDKVEWEDGSGWHSGNVVQANKEFAKITYEKINKSFTIRQTNNQFKIVRRQHIINKYPIGTPVTASNVTSGRVVGQDINNKILFVENYFGDSVEVNLDDPKLRILNIDEDERKQKMRIGTKIKFRIAGTKEWEYGFVEKINPHTIQVKLLQRKLNKGDKITLSLGKVSVDGVIVGKGESSLDIKVENDMSATWEAGKKISLQKGDDYFIVMIGSFGRNKNYMNIYFNTGSELNYRTQIVPLNCLSLTVVVKETDISSSGFINFKPSNNQTMSTHEKMKTYIKRQFEKLIEKEYSMWPKQMANDLNNNLYERYENSTLDYYRNSALLILALNSEDMKIGKYTTFFKQHVKSKLFVFNQLHKSDIETIFPEFVLNPNLKEREYAEGVNTLERIEDLFIEEAMHTVKQKGFLDPTARILPFMGKTHVFITMEPYVMKDIHDVCSNVGSREIPTESLVICQEEGQFYCFSVHDIVANIETADNTGQIPRNPFTGKELEEGFVNRIRRMFMINDKAKEFLETLPKANRNYNLVYGDFETNPRKAVKGITILELLMYNNIVKNFATSKSNEIYGNALNLLQTIAIYFINSIIDILGGSGNMMNNAYYSSTSILRGVDIFFKKHNVSKVWLEPILALLSQDINSATVSRSLVNKRLVDDHRNAMYLYVRELVQYLERYVEFQVSGYLIFGSLLYSFLELIIVTAISNFSKIEDTDPMFGQHGEVYIDSESIKESIMSQPNIKAMFVQVEEPLIAGMNTKPIKTIIIRGVTNQQLEMLKGGNIPLNIPRVRAEEILVRLQNNEDENYIYQFITEDQEIQYAYRRPVIPSGLHKPEQKVFIGGKLYSKTEYELEDNTPVSGTVIDIAGNVSEDKTKWPVQKKLVMSFYQIQPWLLTGKKSVKDVMYKFDEKSGHLLYLLCAKFVKNVLKYSDDSEELKIGSVLSMIAQAMNDLNIPTSSDFVKSMEGVINKYANATKKGFVFDNKHKTLLISAQSELRVMRRNLDYGELKFVESADYALLFALGYLIQYALTETASLNKIEKNGTVTAAALEMELDNDQNINAIYTSKKHLGILEIHNENKGLLTENTCTNAALNGHLEYLKYARENGCPWDENTCASAALNGHLAILKYVRKHGCPWDEYTCTNAALNGHLEILKYARKHGCPWDEYTCASAAEGGHLEVLKYARENGCPWDEKTCALAAEGGHLEVLKYARENGCPWDEDTYTFAAKEGHLKVLKYARKNGLHVDTQEKMDVPGMKKHAHLLQKEDIWKS